MEAMTLSGHHVPDGATVLILFDDHKTAEEAYAHLLDGVSKIGGYNVSFHILDQRVYERDHDVNIYFMGRERETVLWYDKNETIIYNKGRFPQWLRTFKTLRTWF